MPCDRRAWWGLVIVLAGCGAPTAGRDAAPDVRRPDETHTVRLAGSETATEGKGGMPGLAAAVSDPGGDALERAAFEVVRLPARTVVASQRADRLNVPVLPGSVMKVVTLDAALDGVITSRTRWACRRQVRVAGRVLDCSHPPFPEGLTPATALAHSCNDFFAGIAPRIGRERLSRAARALGLPAVPAGADLVLSALGLDGAPVSPRDLLGALVRLGRRVHVDDHGPGFSRAFRPPPADADGVVAGLIECARTGTAAALARSGISALAKTGTTSAPGGGTLGIVVALTPAEAPAHGIVVLAPGAAGRDAAEIGALLLARHVATPEPARGSPTWRVGRLRGDRYEIDTMAASDYVAGVVAAEAPPGAPAALLEALAATARTYAMANRGRHAGEGFDLCDLTHCQAVRPAGTDARRAATRTSGQYLVWREQPAQVFYTASCGGRLDAASAIWRSGSLNDVPYLLARPDPGPHADDEWVSEVSAGEVESALGSAGFQGRRLVDLRIVSRTPGGRAGMLALDGLSPGSITGEGLRIAVGRALGWQVLESALFDVERTPGGYRFRGRGRGHGVGLCVAGASALAASGWNARQILAAYFPGATLVDGEGPVGTTPPVATAARPGRSTQLRVVLPRAVESHRDRVTAALREAVDAAGRATGAPPPDILTLRVHPSVASYERTTGQRWWTAGATAGAVVDVIPLGALDEAGRLETVLRHEVVHVMTEGVLRGAPRWVREGVAAYFAGERPGAAPAAPVATGRGSAGSHTACPADDEFERARSRAALARVYGRAWLCVESHLAGGRDWRTLR